MRSSREPSESPANTRRSSGGLPRSQTSQSSQASQASQASQSSQSSQSSRTAPKRTRSDTTQTQRSRPKRPHIDDTDPGELTHKMRRSTRASSEASTTSTASSRSSRGGDTPTGTGAGTGTSAGSRSGSKGSSPSPTPPGRSSFSLDAVLLATGAPRTRSGSKVSTPVSATFTAGAAGTTGATSAPASPAAFTFTASPSSTAGPASAAASAPTLPKSKTRSESRWARARLVAETKKLRISTDHPAHSTSSSRALDKSAGLDSSSFSAIRPSIEGVDCTPPYVLDTTDVDLDEVVRLGEYLRERPKGRWDSRTEETWNKLSMRYKKLKVDPLNEKMDEDVEVDTDGKAIREDDKEEMEDVVRDKTPTVEDQVMDDTAGDNSKVDQGADKGKGKGKTRVDDEDHMQDIVTDKGGVKDPVNIVKGQKLDDNADMVDDVSDETGSVVGDKMHEDDDKRDKDDKGDKIDEVEMEEDPVKADKAEKANTEAPLAHDLVEWLDPLIACLDPAHLQPWSDPDAPQAESGMRMASLPSITDLDSTWARTTPTDRDRRRWFLANQSSLLEISRSARTSTDTETRSRALRATLDALDTTTNPPASRGVREAIDRLKTKLDSRDTASLDHTALRIWRRAVDSMRVEHGDYPDASSVRGAQPKVGSPRERRTLSRRTTARMSLTQANATDSVMEEEE